MKKSAKHLKPKRKFRKRESYLKKNKITVINYKDIELLKKFISNSGLILAPRITGVTTKEQRKIALAIKRAREMGLLPTRKMRLAN